MTTTATKPLTPKDSKSEPRILPLSLVVVSDYEAGEKTWSDELVAVKTFLSDPEAVPAEILVMEGRLPGEEPPTPPDTLTRHEAVKVHFGNSDRSAELKDLGSRLAKHDLVAVVEADCVPTPGWLARLADAMAAAPSLDVVSGPTIYPGEGMLIRVLTVLDRGYLEAPQYSGGWQHVSNNGALYRRECLLDFPYPGDLSPFVSAERRNRAMREAGLKSGFAPKAISYHAFGGWPFVIDVRRNKGFQYARTLLRRERVAQPMQALDRIRVAFLAVRHSIAADAASVRWVARHHLRLWDWPFLVGLFLVVRLPELFGALASSDEHTFARYNSLSLTSQGEVHG